MSPLTPQPQWPTDPDHRDAVEALLLMAAAEHRGGEFRRATYLLENVEQIIGELPEPYGRMRVGPPEAARLIERS